MVQQRKEPFVGTLLSFLIAGLGQFYAGDIGLGIVFIILGIFFAILDSTIIGLIIGIPGYLTIWLWSMIAAYNTCTKINQSIDQGIINQNQIQT
ncbi:MAG: hypothetical protein NTW79_00110 [Candidatus Berkelbacteria bacterium]|nr:hypothetical protein [Candidatus Berkelbacteria bacterium]